MLTERQVSADGGGLPRRCFSGDWLELYLTFEKDRPGDPVGLQLVYLAPHVAFFALVWKADAGYSHPRVLSDSGGSQRWDFDRSFYGDWHEDFDKQDLLARLRASGGPLEAPLLSRVLEIVERCPFDVRCGRCGERRRAERYCPGCRTRCCAPCAEAAGPVCPTTKQSHAWRQFWRAE